VHDLPDGVALVGVHAALHANYRYLADAPEAEVAGVPDHPRGGEVRQRLVRDLDEIAEAVGKGAEPAAEDDADARRETADLVFDGADGLVESFGDARLGVAHEGGHDIMTS
jgi:hypothetical protein